MNRVISYNHFVLLALFALMGVIPVQANQAGPYHVDATTDPAVIPVGSAKLHLKITDANGEGVTGASIKTFVAMPGMKMGEREQIAQPVPGKPGEYIAPAAFSMAGDYRADIQVNGPEGSGKTSISLATGQNTASAGGVSWKLLLAWLVGVLIVAFVLFRVWKSGQKPNWRGVFNKQVLGGLLLVGIMLAFSIYAVKHWRRPGAMTPIQAQGMEMNMPAPQGVVPVELARVQSGPIASSVRYTGQAVGYVEQEINSRVAGTVVWMTLYAGDRVKKGQLLARLDSSEIDPQVARGLAQVDKAKSDVRVARAQERQAEAETQSARAQLGMKKGAVEEAKNNRTKEVAAIDEARGSLRKAQSMVKEANAQTEARRSVLAEARSDETKMKSAWREAQSTLGAARATAQQAQSDIEVARENNASAVAQAKATATGVDRAEADGRAAAADLEYWKKEIARTKMLLDGGAVSRNEYEAKQAKYENAQAKVQSAAAQLAQAKASSQAAQAKQRRMAAMIQSAESKATSAQEMVESNAARGEQAQAEIASARARSNAAAAQVQAATATAKTANAQVTQAQAQVRMTKAQAAAAGARIDQSKSDETSQSANVRGAQAGQNAADSQIGAAQSDVKLARAQLFEATTKLGYTEIRSLIDGVVTERIISPGVLVQPGQAILKIAEINPIRIQANVAEADLAKIKIGSPVIIGDPSDEGKTIAARVTSIAPQVDMQSRTGVVEAVVPNPQNRFIPGQFVTMQITTGQVKNALHVPSRALVWRAKESGEATSTQPQAYIWIAKPIEEDGNNFSVTRKAVKVGASDGNQTAILSGLSKDERVVVTGYQDLQDGMNVSTPEATPMAKISAAPKQKQSGDIQTASIAVTEKGFEPAELILKPGVPARLTFTRKTDATCGTEVVFPDFGIDKKLPLNVPVEIEFTPNSGEFKFACGMNMLRGKVVVR